MQKNSLSATALMVALSLFSACIKPKEPVPLQPAPTAGNNLHLQYANDHTRIEGIFDRLQDIEHILNIAKTDKEFESSGCATLTRSGNATTIDYGTKNCMNNYSGRYRRGKIFINATGAYNDSGTTYTTTFDNYAEDDYRVEGRKTVTNMGFDSAGLAYLHITIDAIVTRPDGKTITVQWTRVRTSAENFIPGIKLTNSVKFRSTGKGMTTGPWGTVESEIPAKAPLYSARNSRHIWAGFVVYKMPTGSTCTLKYSDSSDPSGDDQATVVGPDGTVKNITIP